MKNLISDTDLKRKIAFAENHFYRDAFSLYLSNRLEKWVFEWFLCSPDTMPEGLKQSTILCFVEWNTAEMMVRGVN